MRIGDQAAAPWQAWITSGRVLDDVVQKDAEEAAAVSAALHLDGPNEERSEASRPSISQEVESFRVRRPTEQEAPTDVKLWNR